MRFCQQFYNANWFVCYHLYQVSVDEQSLNIKQLTIISNVEWKRYEMMQKFVDCLEQVRVLELNKKSTVNEN